MKRFIICIALLCFAETLVHSQTKIERSESSLNQKSDRSRYDRDDDSDSDDWLVDVFGEVFFYLTYYTFFEFPDEVESPMSQAFITKYPYYTSKKGNYNYTADDNFSVFRAELVGRYVSESNDIKGLDVNLDMRFAKRVRIELGYRKLWEKNPEFGNDQLALFNLLVNYHRVRSEQFDLWWGIGTTHVGGNVNQFGFTYAIGAEWFITKPISMEMNFNQTFINSETVNKFNTLLNYHLNRYKLTGGYDQLKLGSQKFTSLTIGVGVFF